MAKFKSAYFLIAGLLFILDQTNAGRGSGRSGGRSGGGRCEGDSACEQTVYIICYIILAIICLVALYIIVQGIKEVIEYEEEQEAPRQLESVNSVQHELDNQAMTIDQPLDAPPPYPTQLNSVQHGLDKSSNDQPLPYHTCQQSGAGHYSLDLVPAGNTTHTKFAIY